MWQAIPRRAESWLYRKGKIKRNRSETLHVAQQVDSVSIWYSATLPERPEPPTNWWTRMSDQRSAAHCAKASPSRCPPSSRVTISCDVSKKTLHRMWASQNFAKGHTSKTECCCATVSPPAPGIYNPRIHTLNASHLMANEVTP